VNFKEGNIYKIPFNKVFCPSFLQKKRVVLKELFVKSSLGPSKTLKKGNT
jgi:hypothetical protein